MLPGSLHRSGTFEGRGFPCHRGHVANTTEGPHVPSEGPAPLGISRQNTVGEGSRSGGLDSTVVTPDCSR